MTLGELKSGFFGFKKASVYQYITSMEEKFSSMLTAKDEEASKAAEQYQQDRIPLTEELAQELVEKAILRAEKRSLKNLLSNRYNKEGYLILKEEHFKE